MSRGERGRGSKDLQENREGRGEREGGGGDGLVLLSKGLLRERYAAVFFAFIFLEWERKGA